MAGHSLAAYTLVVRKKYARGQDAERLLGNIDEEGTRIIEVLQRYLGDLDWDDEERNLSLRPLSVQGPDSDHVLQARVKAGEYGVTSTLENLDDPIDTFPRTERHAEQLGVFLYVKAEPRREVGTFVIHIPHGRGIKVPLTQALTSRFQEEFPDLTLRIDSAVPAEVLRQTIEQGRILKTRFIRRRPAVDEFDRMGEYLQDPTEGEVEVVVKPVHRLASLLKRNFQRVVAGDARTRSLLSFGGRDFDTVKVEVEIGGRRRTIDLGTQSIGRVTWDITDELDYEDGTPTFGSLAEAAAQLVDDLETSTGGRRE